MYIYIHMYIYIIYIYVHIYNIIYIYVCTYYMNLKNLDEDSYCGKNTGWMPTNRPGFDPLPKRSCAHG